MDQQNLTPAETTVEVKFAIHRGDQREEIAIRIPERESKIIHDIFSGSDYVFWSCHLSKTEMTIVDVGAHVGVFTRYAKLQFPHAKMFCFEPDANSYALLSHNTSMLDGVKIFPYALGREEREAEFLVHRTLSACNSLKPTCLPENIASKTKVKVKHAAEMLNSLELGTIDILKVDTEGAELDIFHALKENGVLDRVEQILLEFHSHQDRRDLDQLLENFIAVKIDIREVAGTGTASYIRKDILRKDFPPSLQNLV
jgi:FkbM family methyltransferase